MDRYIYIYGVFKYFFSLIFYFYFWFVGVGKALEGENKWYFFSRMIENRVSPNGNWKVMGVDEPVLSGNRTVGLKKCLVFHIGEASSGMQTNWVMHEFHLLDCSSTASSSRSSRRKGKAKMVSNIPDSKTLVHMWVHVLAKIPICHHNVGPTLLLSRPLI